MLPPSHTVAKTDDCWMFDILRFAYRVSPRSTIRRMPALSRLTFLHRRALGDGTQGLDIRGQRVGRPTICDRDEPCAAGEAARSRPVLGLPQRRSRACQRN